MLGNPSNIREAGEAGRSSLIEAADGHARSLLLLLRTLRAEGTITIGAVTRVDIIARLIDGQNF